MAQTRREKKSEETGALWLAVMREMLRGSGVAVAVTLLALLACALLVSNGTIGDGSAPDQAQPPASGAWSGRLSVPVAAVGGMPALRLRLCVQ